MADTRAATTVCELFQDTASQHGDRDALYPVNMAVELYAAIPCSYLWVIPNGGHGPIFGDMADRFVETSLAFLNDEWS